MCHECLCVCGHGLKRKNNKKKRGGKGLRVLDFLVLSFLPFQMVKFQRWIPFDGDIWNIHAPIQEGTHHLRRPKLAINERCSKNTRYSTLEKLPGNPAGGATELYVDIYLNKLGYN